MIGKVIFALVDVAFTVAMAADETLDRAKRYARVFRRRSEPDPVPLSWRDVEHQRAQMQSATTGAARVRAETIRPPPPLPSEER